jgi:signal transduction histidine kinase
VSRRVLIPLALLGLFVGFFGEGFSIHLGQTPAVAWMDLAVGLAYIGAGLVAWRRRPDNRLGQLMTALGFAWFIGAWSNTPPFMGSGAPHWDAYRIAVAFDALGQALLVHLLLAFPSGRVTSRPSRVLVAAGYANVLLLGFGRVLFIDFFARGIWAYYHYRGFQGYLALHPDRAIADAMQRAYEAVWAAVLLAAVVVIARRWYVSTTATRRSLAPLWFAGAVVAISISVAAPTVVGGFFSAGWEETACCTGGIENQFLVPDPYFQIPDSARASLFWAVRAGQLLVPLVFLFGLLRMRLARLGVSRLVVELGDAPPPDRLRDALARTLGDPSLQVAYWIPGSNGYVDDQGRPFALPAEGSGRTVTVLEREGERVAALVHDQALADQPELVRAAGAATRLALENERLHAEVRAQLEEVRESRARIVESADAERRRVERDLHDGAQQRLVTLSLALRQAQAQARSNGGAVASSLDQAIDELKLALSELRELARGIHPAVLTEQGLAPALESLAERSPVAATVDVGSIGRLPASVEATAYFVVSEALANAAKHARASWVAVTASARDGRLMVEVSDNGVGGAEMSKGSGLRGLADRVAALGGDLTVGSPPNRGTRVVAEIPCPQ